MGLAVMLSLGFLGTSSPADDKNKEAATDEQFVMKASAAGLAEVNLGRIAAERGSSAEVKRFGQHMVEDHTKANKELIELANKKGWKVAAQMERPHQEAAEKLTKLEGADFDRQFMSQMVKDHEEAVDLFSSKGKDARDEELKAFATKTLPTLKEHLKMAKDLDGGGKRKEK